MYLVSDRSFVFNNEQYKVFCNGFLFDLLEKEITRIKNTSIVKFRSNCCLKYFNACESELDK